jgi:hypothetical protein
MPARSALWRIGMIYRPKHIHSLAPWDFDDGWRFNVVGISPTLELVPDLIVKAQQAVRRMVRQMDGSENTIGYVILHEAVGLHYFGFGIWINENEDIFRGFQRRHKERSFNESELNCIWDIHARAWQADKWREHVLLPSQPNYEAYLRATILEEY